MTLRILSLGGGTQSCALALMSASGELPKLDAIVFADTNDDLMGRESPSDKNPTPPMHVLNPDGTKGRIGQYRCSYDYKRRVVTQAVKKLCGGRGAWKRSDVEQWIGFSLDETKRMKQADECRCGHKRVKRVKGDFVQIHTADGCTRCACEKFDPWLTNRWPLIDLRMKRDDTIRWFGANGHPTPARSACWFCPNSGNERWQALKIGRPELFEKATRLDEATRHGGGFNARGNKAFAGQMFLHQSLTPLRDADLRTSTQVRSDAGEVPLFDADALAADCDAGECFT